MKSLSHIDGRIPVFGCLSVLAPFIGAAICLLFYVWLYSKGPLHDNADSGFQVRLAIVIAVTIASGVIFGGIAIVRRERYLWLAYTGLLLSASPIILAILGALFHISA